MTANWTHLKTDSHSRDLRPGLEARIHDPLWLLHRQWQMGEFRGEDAGSPIRVTVDSSIFKADGITLDGVNGPYRPEDAPLEATVERERADQAAPDLRSRAQIGLDLLTRLERAGVAVDRSALVSRFAFQEALDGEEGAVRLLARRTPEGLALRRAFPLGGTEGELAAVFPELDGPGRAAGQPVVAAWLAAVDARLGRPGERDAWREDRLEYAFGLSVPTDIGRLELTADEYPGGRLDWDAFRFTALDSTDTRPADQTLSQTLLPAPVTFPGMPAPWLWQFEDAAVDFGDPEAMEQDIGRLLLAEFVMAWGNDWFQVPVEVPTGALCRIDSLLVTDTFGVTTRVINQRRHSPFWAMNRLGRTVFRAELDDFLFVPPVLPAAHQAPAMETVLVMPDEQANMAWAVETVLPDPLGRPRERGEVLRPPVPVVGGNVRYRVMTDLPEQWLPLMPVYDPAAKAHFLVRAGLLDEIDEIAAPEPKGEILSRGEAFRVHREEVPRAGIQVERAWQLSRWYDGHRVAWVGRRKGAGVGELRSELTFDALLGLEEGV